MIQPQDIPINCCELVGDELRFFFCDVTKGDYYDVGIDSVMYGVDREVLVDYGNDFYPVSPFYRLHVPDSLDTC